MATPTPVQLDLQRDKQLRVLWPDGRESVWTVAELRQLCPCAACKILREGKDPHQLFRPATPDEVADPSSDELQPLKKKSLSLSVMPKQFASATDAVTVTSAEPVGNYAIRLNFSDGHESGIFSWSYLHELAREAND